MLDWLIEQWPLAVGGAAAATGFAAWVQNIKSVRELQLKIKLLERQLEESDRRLVKPTAEEIAQYGVARSSQRRTRMDVPTALLLVAIVTPVVVYAYREHRTQVEVSQLRNQLKEVDDRLTDVERQLQMATEELEDLQRRAIAELSGTAGTRLPGAGPAYNSLTQRERDLRTRQEQLESSRQLLHEQRRALERLIIK